MFCFRKFRLQFIGFYAIIKKGRKNVRTTRHGRANLNIKFSFLTYFRTPKEGKWKTKILQFI